MEERYTIEEAGHVLGWGNELGQQEHNGSGGCGRYRNGQWSSGSEQQAWLELRCYHRRRKEGELRHSDQEAERKRLLQRNG